MTGGARDATAIVAPGTADAVADAVIDRPPRFALAPGDAPD